MKLSWKQSCFEFLFLLKAQIRINKLSLDSNLIVQQMIRINLLLLQLLIPGLCLGCVYGLNGVGSALLYKGSRTINNAQGAIIGFGALFGYTLQVSFGLGLIPSTILATIIVFFVGLFLQVGIVSKIEKIAPVNIVIATLALNLIISSINNLVYGTYVYESAVVKINGNFRSTIWKIKSQLNSYQTKRTLNSEV